MICGNSAHRLLPSIVMLVALVATPALARYDAKTYSRTTPAYQKCLDSHDGETTAGMIECTVEEIKIQDAALNAAYAKAMAQLNDRQKNKLRVAQRAWIAFRNTDCQSQEDEDWGTISRVNAAGCVLQRTLERLDDLTNYPPGREPPE